MKQIETANYRLRDVRESDFEHIKAMLIENEYLGVLWNIPSLQDGKADEIVRDIYINPGSEYPGKSYCVEDKATGEFKGYLSMSIDDDREGELSVRLREGVEMQEVMGLFGELLTEVVGEQRKNFTMQFSME